eukprot:g4396.t1
MGSAASLKHGDVRTFSKEEALAAVEIAFAKEYVAKNTNLSVSDVMKAANVSENYVQWKKAYADCFVPAKGEECADENWTGTLVDTFSPDFSGDKMRKPWDPELRGRRYINIDEEGTLRISGTDGNGDQWGLRFDKTTTASPVITKCEGGSVRKCSFRCKAPENIDAKAGALEFIVELGTVFGNQKCIRWTTLYEGKGGAFGEFTHPPNDAENFWCFV